MYVEFGSGASTYWAARLQIPFITTDSDRYFLDSVRDKIRAEGLDDPSRQRFRHADIGLTKAWGKPVVFGRPSQRRLDKFRNYSEFPDTEEMGMPQPDLVLVDGRFRIACALKACRALRGHTDWVVVIDDYADRRHYHAVEEIARLDCCIGRLGVFRQLLDVSMHDIERAIQRYETDPL